MHERRISEKQKKRTEKQHSFDHFRWGRFSFFHLPFCSRRLFVNVSVNGTCNFLFVCMDFLSKIPPGLKYSYKTYPRALSGSLMENNAYIKTKE